MMTWKLLDIWPCVWGRRRLIIGLFDEGVVIVQRPEVVVIHPSFSTLRSSQRRLQNPRAKSKFPAVGGDGKDSDPILRFGLVLVLDHSEV